MRSSLADTLSSSVSASHPESPPLVFIQAPEGRGRFVLLGLLVPLLAALMAPFWLVAVQLAVDPAARAALAARPLAGGQLLAGLVMLVCVFGWPLARLLSADLSRRHVVIAAGLVHSHVVGPFGTRLRTQPLAAYSGLARRVRTSLSGVHQDILLVHRDPARSLVLGPASQIPEATQEALARLFAVAEIPSREAASVAPTHGSFGTAEPHPRLAA